MRTFVRSVGETTSVTGARFTTSTRNTRISFTEQQLEGLSEVAMQKQKSREEIVAEYIIDGLKREGVNS